MKFLMYFWMYGVMFYCIVFMIYMWAAKNIPEIQSEIMRLLPYLDLQNIDITQNNMKLLGLAIAPVVNYLFGALMMFYLLTIKLKALGKMDWNVIDILIEAKEKEEEGDDEYDQRS